MKRKTKETEKKGEGVISVISLAIKSWKKKIVVDINYAQLMCTCPGGQQICYIRDNMKLRIQTTCTCGAY